MRRYAAPLLAGLAAAALHALGLADVAALLIGAAAWGLWEMRRAWG